MRPPFVAALLAASILFVPAAAALLTGVDTGPLDAVVGVGSGEYLVGYHEGQEDAALLAIQLAGGSVRRHDADVNLVLAATDDSDRFGALVLLSPSIEFAETNDPVRLAGAQWNGAEWNGVEWNGAEWNGAEWNGAQWNGAQWNGAQWNGAHGAPSSLNDPGRLGQWGLVAADVPPAWRTSFGTRAAELCVLDSGLAWDHKDIAPNAWKGPNGERGYDVLGDDAFPYDDAGHGTHVAGIAAAAINNAWGVAGVGNVRILPVKVLDANGTGTEADVAWGLSWCARQGADVALMALSASEASPALDRALAYAALHDVVLVASAGNDGPCDACVAYPASHPAVIAVAAIDARGTAASFSAKGIDVELAAPGVDILSTLPRDRYAFGSGTSQASAFVAGAAALLRDTYPDLGATDVRAILRATARDAGTTGPDTTYGAGILDVDAAMARAGEA